MAKLLYTVTDSLCCDIVLQTDDVYIDVCLNLSEYDTSEYHSDYLLFSKANANLIGKFNDETNGVVPLGICRSPE